MMAAIAELFRSFGRCFIWWVVIQPWELGVRVRLGGRRQKLRPGLSFRIPYADVIYRQSVRLRFTTLFPQTVSTRDGHTLTMAGVLGYAITDIDKLYDTLHQAEDAIRSMAQGAIANYVQGNDLSECLPGCVEGGACDGLDLTKYGLALDSLRLTTFARVKTYRFIMDNHTSIWEDALNTRFADGPNGKPA